MEEAAALSVTRDELWRQPRYQDVANSRRGSIDIVNDPPDENVGTYQIDWRR